MPQMFRVVKMTDRQIGRMVDEFLKNYNGAHVSARIGDVNTSYPSQEFEPLLKGKDLGAITTVDAHVGSPPIYLRFRRGVGGTQSGIDAGDRKPSPYFDEIWIDAPANHHGGQASIEDVLAITRIVKQHASLLDGDHINGESTTEASELLKLQFSQLNEQLTEINTISLKRRQELEEDFARRRMELEEEAVNSP